MRLRELITETEVVESAGDLDQEISGLSYDSRQISAGNMFFAVPGEKSDGHDFIADTIRRGASAFVYSKQGAWPHSVTSVRVKDVRRAMGLAAATFYHRPSRRLKLVGVTGTNGKTTLTYLLESILKAAALEPGVIGTINYRFRDRVVPSHHTTPESLDLQRMLAEMAAASVQSVAMEVSSHALAQERVRGLEFDVGVFTNLSRDHLDYHRDMDEYFVAKSRLFSDYLSASPKADKAAVIYGEDPRGEALSNLARAHGLDVWTYGEGPAWDVHPVTIEKDVAGLRGKIVAKGHTVELVSSLIGSANLQNILGSAAVGFALGLDAGSVSEGIKQLKAVPGRVEKVDNPCAVTILVDYAHTPDALEKVLTAVRPLTQGKLITVFGCGGDRDRGKRPAMGEIAARLSDLIIVTSDNPRSEQPLAILDDIEAGIRKTGLKKFQVSGLGSRIYQRDSGQTRLETEHGYVLEADRRSAIRSALDWARPGDLVLIAGKGHEDYQILGTRKIHFDDREVAREEAFARVGA
jgi:UDP-N-acetylmuramoyl-L-alanyl-D-glutamate--2,6-diaminopimelate ligase